MLACFKVLGSGSPAKSPKIPLFERKIPLLSPFLRKIPLFLFAKIPPYFVPKQVLCRIKSSFFTVMVALQNYTYPY